MALTLAYGTPKKMEDENHFWVPGTTWGAGVMLDLYICHTETRTKSI